MKILFLSTWFPYPPDNGSRIRAYNLLKQLAQQHEISLVSFARDGRGEDLGDLSSMCTSVEVVPWIEYAPRRLRALLGFFSPTPRSIVDTHSSAMAQLVQTKVASHRYDLLVALQMGTARYVPKHCSLPAVFDEIESGVLLDALEQAVGTIGRARRWLTWAKRQRYLRHLVRHFAACTVVSAEEMDILRMLVPEYEAVSVVSNGVDVERLQPGIIAAEPNTLIYTGALTYAANYDAVFHFLSEILPMIQKAVPDVQLKVTGSTRNVAINRLPSHEGVCFTGYVNDIRPVVAGSWASVVPLRIGGGTRLKILEAMALGTPVISTSKGAEGLEVTHGEDILIADDPREFAAQTIRLLRDPALRQHLAENGRRLVEQKYDWRLIGEQFNRLIESVVDIGCGS